MRSSSLARRALSFCHFQDTVAAHTNNYCIVLDLFLLCSWWVMGRNHSAEAAFRYTVSSAMGRAAGYATMDKGSTAVVQHLHYHIIDMGMICIFTMSIIRLMEAFLERVDRKALTLFTPVMCIHTRCKSQNIQPGRLIIANSSSAVIPMRSSSISIACYDQSKEMALLGPLSTCRVLDETLAAKRIVL